MLGNAMWVMGMQGLCAATLQTQMCFREKTSEDHNCGLVERSGICVFV